MTDHNSQLTVKNLLLLLFFFFLGRTNGQELTVIIFVKNGPNFFDEKVKGCLYVRNLVVG